MLLVKKILNEHDKYTTSQSLKDCLGDGYLLQNNPIYLAIRVAATHSDFKFSNERFYEYDAMALTQLPKILKKKVIPYLDNVTALREIEKARPGKFTLNDIPPLRGNQIFHESAHAVANTILSWHLKDKGKSDIERVLRILFQEAFANACESFSNLYAHDRFHNEFLYKNSYIMEEPNVRRKLLEGMNTAGETQTFIVLLFSFLYANFLQTETADREFQSLLDLLVPNANKKESAALFKVFGIGFTLDLQFTEFTNKFCLQLAGLKTTPEQLSKVKLQAWFKDPRYARCLEDMVNTVCSF
ncbi:MAG: hypothetical protein JST80_06720 [Bdellovibrionales bacterium]|nr:hypothetical protein [Bdellovibrionales bacterium]